MASTKSAYDQILENQAKLMTVMSDYTTAVMDMMMPKKASAEETMEMMNEYISKTTAMMESMASKEHMEAYQKDFWSTFTADYTKNMEAAMDFYKRSAAYMKQMWSSEAMATQQERAQKLSSLYQSSLKAFYDTAKDNTKAMQEYFSAN